MAYHLNRRTPTLGPDFTKLLDTVFGSLAPAAACTPGSDCLVPSIDVTESEESYLVRAELPGVAAGDIEISVDDGLLNIRGEKKRETTTETETARRTERVYGSFERKLRLPDGVDADAVGAASKDGILTVTLPKLKEAKARKIEISVQE